MLNGTGSKAADTNHVIQIVTLKVKFLKIKKVFLLFFKSVSYTRSKLMLYMLLYASNE